MDEKVQGEQDVSEPVKVDGKKEEGAEEDLSDHSDFEDAMPGNGEMDESDPAKAIDIEEVAKRENGGLRNAEISSHDPKDVNGSPNNESLS